MKLFFIFTSIFSLTCYPMKQRPQTAPSENKLPSLRHLCTNATIALLLEEKKKKKQKAFLAKIRALPADLSQNIENRLSNRFRYKNARCTTIFLEDHADAIVGNYALVKSDPPPSLKVYSLITGQHVNTINTADDPKRIKSISALEPVGNSCIAIGSYRKPRIAVWNLQARTCTHRFRRKKLELKQTQIHDPFWHSPYIETLAHLPNSPYLIVLIGKAPYNKNWDEAKILRGYDLEKGKPLPSFETSCIPFCGQRMLKAINKKLFITVTRPNLIFVWSVDQKKPLRKIRVAHKEGGCFKNFTRIVLSQNRNYFFAYHPDYLSKVVLYDATKNKRTHIRTDRELFSIRPIDESRFMFIQENTSLESGKPSLWGYYSFHSYDVAQKPNQKCERTLLCKRKHKIEHLLAVPNKNTLVLAFAEKREIVIYNLCDPSKPTTIKLEQYNGEKLGYILNIQKIDNTHLLIITGKRRPNQADLEMLQTEEFKNATRAEKKRIFSRFDRRITRKINIFDLTVNKLVCSEKIKFEAPKVNSPNISAIYTAANECEIQLPHITQSGKIIFKTPGTESELKILSPASTEQILGIED